MTDGELAVAVSMNAERIGSRRKLDSAEAQRAGSPFAEWADVSARMRIDAGDDPSKVSADYMRMKHQQTVSNASKRS